MPLYKCMTGTSSRISTLDATCAAAPSAWPRTVMPAQAGKGGSPTKPYDGKSKGNARAQAMARGSLPMATLQRAKIMQR